MWNVSGLNTPIIRERCQTIISNPSICYLQETCLKCKNMERLKLKDEKRNNASTNQNEVGAAKLISDKVNFMARSTTKNTHILWW